MIIVIDLDGTICFPNLAESDVYYRYGLAEPNKEVIQQMQDLRNKGYRFIIHTARRMLTTNGNLTKVYDEVGKLTEDWLALHNVPYESLIFGKPYGDYYVDDKALTIGEFLKCGKN